MSMNSKMNLKLHTKLMMLLGLFCLTGVIACMPSSRYEQSLEQSGGNRGELERAIAHYDSLGDTEKKQAALFLIENMIGKRSIVFHDTVAYHRLLRYLSTINDPIRWDPALSVLSKSIDSIVSAFPQRTTMSSDLQTIKAGYLINNIDRAFDSWNKALWSKEYTFEEFCQYVLPYKLGQEELEDWRSVALLHQAPSEDSILQKETSSWKMAVLLINNTGFYYNVGMSRFPYPMNVSDLNAAKIGACEQMANLAISYFRSRGIPSAVDLLPAWANRSSAHVWSVVILPDKKIRSIDYHPKGTNGFAYKISKIYRQMYEMQPLPSLASNETLPSFFAQGYTKDVTAQYDMPLADLTVDLMADVPVNNVYLSTFNNRSWVPVAVTEKKGRKAEFSHVGCGVLPKENDAMMRYINQGEGIVYLPVYSITQGICAAADPFILDTLGKVTTLKPAAETEKVRLCRKYPKHPNFVGYEKSLVGGRFECANRADFSDAELLCTISRPQQYPLERLVATTSKKYRYVRFTPVNSAIGYFSEFQFFDDKGKRLDGRPLGVREVFDGNLLTFSYKHPGIQKVLALDLGIPEMISEVAFSARTDDNEVMPGQEYELLYWDGKWISLGRRVPEEYYVDYEVPKNALLWLRNHTKGVEERIFTIKEGQQIWW